MTEREKQVGPSSLGSLDACKFIMERDKAMALARLRMTEAAASQRCIRVGCVRVVSGTPCTHILVIHAGLVQIYLITHGGSRMNAIVWYMDATGGLVSARIEGGKNSNADYKLRVT